IIHDFAAVPPSRLRRRNRLAPPCPNGGVFSFPLTPAPSEDQPRFFIQLSREPYPGATGRSPAFTLSSCVAIAATLPETGSGPSAPGYPPAGIARRRQRSARS